MSKRVVTASTIAADEQLARKPKPVVNLALTHDEAQFLCDLMGHIGGCPRNSRRKMADEIKQGLLCVTDVVDHIDIAPNFRVGDMSGSIICEETD